MPLSVARPVPDRTVDVSQHIRSLAEIRPPGHRLRRFFLESAAKVVPRTDGQPACDSVSSARYLVSMAFTRSSITLENPATRSLNHRVRCVSNQIESTTLQCQVYRHDANYHDIVHRSENLATLSLNTTCPRFVLNTKLNQIALNLASRVT